MIILYSLYFILNCINHSRNANHGLDVVAYPRVHESLTGDGPEHIIPYNGNLSLMQSDVLSKTENVVQKYGFAIVISE